VSTLAKVVLVLLAAGLGMFVASWLVGTTDENPAIEVKVPSGLYNPVSAGEELPTGFRQLLARDAIRPIYDPTFRSADETSWPDNTLVVGLEINGDARAYPVSFLHRREIVNDHVGKTPVLVTW